MMTRASGYLCANSTMTLAHTHTYNQVLLWGSRANVVAFTDYLHTSLITSASLSHTHSDEDRSPERSVSDFTESFPLPRSQTSLCCSKNKIPPVKLSALRFGAFNAEANQKTGKRLEARPPWQGRRFQDHACNVGPFQVCAKVRARKSTENANLRSRFEAPCFNFQEKRLPTAD